MRFVLLSLIATFSQTAWAKEVSDRNLENGHFAIVIGQSRGNAHLPLLKYAGRDARRFFDTLFDVTDIAPRHARLLLNSKRSDIVAEMKTLKQRVSAYKARYRNRKTRLTFFYSGHAESDGFLINGEKLSYQDLRDYLKEPAFDIKIAILDACFSGNIIALKGGRASPDFKIDLHASSSLEGTAILTSSAINQRAQEWDVLESSLFTHYVLAGMRGAADRNGDRIVDVNELYAYTQNQVLDRSSRALTPSQNPSYLIDFKGAGSVVVASLDRSKSHIIFAAGLVGTIIIRNIVTGEFHEIKKSQLHAMTLSLPPSDYAIVLKKTDGKQVVWQVALAANDRFHPQLKYAVSDNRHVAVLSKGKDPANDQRVDWRSEMRSVGRYARTTLPGKVIQSTKRYVSRDHRMDRWNFGLMSGPTATTMTRYSGDSRAGLYVLIRDVFGSVATKLTWSESSYMDDSLVRYGSKNYYFSPEGQIDAFQIAFYKSFHLRNIGAEMRLGPLFGMSTITVDEIDDNAVKYWLADMRKQNRQGTYLPSNVRVRKSFTSLDVGVSLDAVKHLWWFRVGLHVAPSVSLYIDNDFDVDLAFNNWLGFTFEI